MHIRAAVAHGFRQPLSIESPTLGRPGHGEVLIENKAAGLCHSDLFILEGGADMGMPLIAGHEGAGIVLECGPGVTRLKPGDHVVTCAIGECGHCAQCASRRTNLCETAGLPAMMLAFGPSAHFRLNGGNISTMAPGATFSSHTIVGEDFATKIPTDVPFHVACLFGCAVLTGVGSVLHTAQVEKGAKVAVFGLGGIGLNVLDGSQLAEAGMIIGIDANPAKEAVGRRFGMTDFIDGRGDDVVRRIQDLTGGGVDYAFECVGNPALGAMALEATRPEWGVVVQIGASPPGHDLIPLSIPQILSGRSVLGSYFGKSKIRTDMAKMVEWFREGRLHTDQLVSHRLPLESINEGFELMRRGESIRTVIEF